MIARGFASVVWVGAVGAAALGCYMLSLQVATERAELAKVERSIIAAKQEIRSLQTELGTRGRLSQLEQWNTDVLALSAPASAQFLPSEFTLARLDQRESTVRDVTSQIRMASTEQPAGERGNSTEPSQAAVAVPDPAIRMATAVIRTPTAPQAAPSRQVKGPAASKPAPLRLAKATPGLQPVPVRQAKAPPAQLAAAFRQASYSTPAAPQPSRRIDSRLADEIGAAARAEKKAGSGGAP